MFNLIGLGYCVHIGNKSNRVIRKNSLNLYQVSQILSKNFNI